MTNVKEKGKYNISMEELFFLKGGGGGAFLLQVTMAAKKFSSDSRQHPQGNSQSKSTPSLQQ